MKNLTKYLKGELSEKELDDFTKKLVQAKFDKEKKEQWSRLLEEEHGIKRKADKPKVTPFSPRFLKAAAAIALIIVALFFYPRLVKPSLEQLADNYLKYEKFEGRSTRKGADEISLLRMQAMTAYDASKYQEAIGIYNKILELEKNSLDDRFYLALNALYLKKYENAIHYFLEARTMGADGNDRFREEINWFLSLTYLKSGAPEKAKIELAKISVNEWNFEKAQQMLEKME